MTRWEHRLEGLEPDNLLAFMALLGLLRALETSHPDWCPRARWDLNTAPWRPTLSLRADVDRQTISAAAAEGIDALAGHQQFSGRKAIDFSQEEAQAELSANERDRRAAVEALLTPAAYKDDGKPIPTPYCLMFGQGHQHFLQRLADVPTTPAPPKRGRGGSARTLSAAECITEALFEPWQRKDGTGSFRWDAVEANRYALRAKNPSGDAEAGSTQHGANRLAGIALPALPTVAIARRGEARTLAVGTCYLSSGTVGFSWPLWRVSASIHAILVLMRALYEVDSTGADHPHAPGEVLAKVGAERISLGKFMNIAPAQIHWRTTTIPFGR